MTDGGHLYWHERAATYDDAVRAIIGDPTVDALDAWLSARIRPDDHVVDLGCGTGRLTARLAETAAHVTGVELAAGMLERARVRVDGRPNVTLQRSDASRTLLPTGQATLVVAVNLLHVVPSPTAVIDEAFRLLRSGGRFLVADYTPSGMTEPEVQAMKERMRAAWGAPSTDNRPTFRGEAVDRLLMAGFDVRSTERIGTTTGALCMVAVRP